MSSSHDTYRIKYAKDRRSKSNLTIFRNFINLSPNFSCLEWLILTKNLWLVTIPLKQCFSFFVFQSYAWFMSTLGFASIGNLTVMAVERWLLVARPMKALSIRWEWFHLLLLYLAGKDVSKELWIYFVKVKKNGLDFVGRIAEQHDGRSAPKISTRRDTRVREQCREKVDRNTRSCIIHDVFLCSV